MRLQPHSPEWYDRLATVQDGYYYRWDSQFAPGNGIEQRLAIGGLTLHSWWSFEVPEVFPGPAQLYDCLAWGWRADEVSSFAEVRLILEGIFTDYGGPHGVELRHIRHLWKAVVPA